MLAKKLRMYRKRAGYSINDLAEIIGTSRQTIYRYETGSITNIPFERITQMARAFGVPMTELIEESPSRDFDILESGIYDHIYNDNGKYEEGAGFDTPILTMPIGVRRIPMLGEIACGEPRFASEEHDNFAIVSDDLSVDVGGIHSIAVNKRQTAYATSGKGFHRVSSHTAYAKYCHFGVLQFFYGFLAQ